MVAESNNVSDHVCRMLAGAALEEIRAHSTQLWLRFLSDRLVSGKLLYVDLVFGCAAYMADAQGRGDTGEVDFFEQRSAFLAAVYQCIGVELAGAEVYGDGRLLIRVDNNKALVLRPAAQDLENDDWVWRLVAEAQEQEMPGLCDVYCVSAGQAFEVTLHSTQHRVG